jgi:hypothetical protein
MPGEFYIEGKKEKLDISDLLSGISELKEEIAGINDHIEKLHGEEPVSGSVTGNWNSGTATSGETGADVVTVGEDGTKKKLHSLLMNMGAFQSGAKITIKLFMQINGIECKVYEEEFKRGRDPDGLWIVNGTVGIHEALRVEAESNKAADDGVAMDYDYLLEAM